MKILFLSEKISHQQTFGNDKYLPPYNISIDFDDINNSDNFEFSIFDYDVSIIHINYPKHHTIGYFNNLPKISKDCKKALENGRTIILLPESKNFSTKFNNNYGPKVYEWLEALGVTLENNKGDNYTPTKFGKSKDISDYLGYCQKYYQIITSFNHDIDRILAVVNNTEIVVGLDHTFGNGSLVILPPPFITDNNYLITMSALIRLASYFHEKAERKIYISNTPDWLETYLDKHSLEINKEIEELLKEKHKHDIISYSLYGSGTDLEQSVALILTEFNLDVEKQPNGANIDLKAKTKDQTCGFAVEVTGTKSIIRKDTKKISQAWKYLSERSGTNEENDRLIIIANTQCHLDPKDRNPNSFSQEVIKLLGRNEVLLMTTIQLYKLWKSYQENQISRDEIAKSMYMQVGIYNTPKLLLINNNG